jgi:1-acyl-sn-glycerol-3-phosphate acyltransferase
MRCVEVLEGGEPLVVYPEGQRRSGPIVEEIYDGAAYIALRAGVPIVPIGIGGSERAMPKGKKFLYPVKVHAVIGAPIEVKPREGNRVPRVDVRELSAQLRDELQRLFDVAQVRVGA